MSHSTPAENDARQGDHAVPEPIEAIKLRHPWRTVFAVVIAAVAILFIYDAAFNRPVYSWGEVGKYLFDVRVISAIGYTLQLTVYSMLIAIVLGIVLAVMRLSPNPVLSSVAWLFLWVFRGTPVYVQLTFWGLIGVIYKTIDIGIPFTDAMVSFSTKELLSYFTLAVIGLALNEAAYMAEIVRAGLLSVDKGQEEASSALGLGWWHTMSRVILPQAMRVIIPPTGNEVISMLKTTSLVTAVPFTLELYTRTRDIAAVTYKPVPMLIVASIWYLVITSILMVGQYYIERHFSKGIGARPDAGPGAGAVGPKTDAVIGAVGSEPRANAALTADPGPVADPGSGSGSGTESGSASKAGSDPGTESERGERREGGSA